jgi:hypothetical protein
MALLGRWIMPIEKPLSNSGYIRPAGISYKVKDKDSWETVARANGLTAAELVHFNCGTNDSAEVNWWLRHKVGCKKATTDHLNWMFSSDADPGIIYIPNKDWKRPVPPPHHDDPAAKPEPSGVWFGFGGQTGGHLALGGKDTVEACLYSLETYQNRFWINIDGWRIGPGLGASVGVVFIVATGVLRPSDLANFSVGGVDFQANMAGRWGDLLKGAKEINMVRKFAKGGMVLDKTIGVAKWEKLRDIINGIRKTGGAYFGRKEKSLTVVPIPGAGVGLEVSLFYGWGTVFVHGQTLEGK